ncbi:MAG TPA: HD domain-containing protein [Candidatus Xenobia bacterium]
MPPADKVIRDAVHRDIVLDGEVQIPLLDTLEMQRMRGIKQLGTASLVYPTALHTRFDHSLGTSWLTRRLIQTMEQVQGPLFSAEDKVAVQAAALLHDISHIPYGHTFEDERRIFDRHDTEERLTHFLTHGQVGKVLAQKGLTAAVLAILSGRGGALTDLVSGTICADLLDYLARDTYFCGLTQSYDDRIFRYFRLGLDGLYLDAQKNGVLREDVISEIINLLRLRYFLSERVYFHHAKTASGAMISRAVEAAVQQGLKLPDLYRLRDEGLLHLLATRYGDAPGMATLLEAFEGRHIYQRCFLLTRRIGDELQQQLVERYHRSAAEREAAEAYLIKKNRLKPGELIIYCPAEKMMLKEAHVPVKVDTGPPRLLSSLGIPEVEALMDKHRNLWKFYVFVARHRAERLKAISTSCETWFCQANHLPALQSGQLYYNW